MSSQTRCYRFEYNERGGVLRASRNPAKKGGIKLGCIVERCCTFGSFNQSLLVLVITMLNGGMNLVLCREMRRVSVKSSVHWQGGSESSSNPLGNILASRAGSSRQTNMPDSPVTYAV